jgi:succinate dehydrogenase / fumarate reductase flavoprotein subunit
VEDTARTALLPFERDPKEGPYQVQHDLQNMMQDLVGIVRTEPEMQEALQGLQKLKARAARAGVPGNREYNPGWHTALDLHNLLTVSEAITLSAIERKESRGGHFRDDYPAKDAAYAGFNLIVKKGPDGSMQVSRRPLPKLRDDLAQIVEENK